MQRLLGLTLLFIQIHAQIPETYKASQCFKSPGIPQVSFSCPPDSMIKISNAFHGIAADERRVPEQTAACVPSPGHEHKNCTFCPGDCVDDSMNLVYDWSTCMGNISCHRTVMQSYMPDCQGPDKFSDYLQVEYQCVPRPSVVDICSHVEEQWQSEGGFLMSPNYPRHYPTDQDCMCTLSTDSGSKIVLSFFDLLLETRKGRCRADWLMLRQNDQKHRHCGAIMTGTKNITSASSSLQLQFHSDANNNVTQTFQYFTRVLKGFWLYYSAVPKSSIKVSCRALTPSDPSVREIWLDDSDYDELINTKETKRPGDSANQDRDNNEENEIAGEDNKMNGDKKMSDPDSTENEILGKDDKDKVGKENGADFQEGKEPHKSSSCKNGFSLTALISLIFVCLLH